MTVVKYIAYLAFVVSVPLFLIATNVRILANAPLLYSYGFDKYDISTVTDIEREELISAGRQIRDYFNNEERWIDIAVNAWGGTYNIFYSEGEDVQTQILHMYDVKVLVRTLYNVQVATGLILLLLVPIALAAAPRTFPRTFFKLLPWGSALTLGIIGALGVFALTGFSQAFETFHIISFNNNLWQLDPSRHYLMAMFPEGFFFDATMILAAATVLEALLILVVSTFALMKTRPQSVEDEEEGPEPRMVQTQYGSVPEHLLLTPEDRATNSQRSVRSERLADWGIVAYYITEVVLLAIVPAILPRRRAQSAEAS